MAKRRGGRPGVVGVGGALVALAYTLWTALVVATPLLGVWIASSLAAWRGLPRTQVVLAGLVLFPLGPVLWELVGHWRWLRKRRPRRFLTVFDRLTLRTLALNVAFLGVLLGTQARSVFTALSTRGDWMLEGRSGPTADSARVALAGAAGLFEWLHEVSHPNPFRGRLTPPPPPQPRVYRTPGRLAWPLPATVHPAVLGIPPPDEASIAALGRFLQHRLPDPVERARAVHDYVADRVAYDVPSYRAHRYPPQDAETVFRTHLGVCAGYAHLFEALARASGLEAVYLVGEARTGPEGTSESHAWNAVRLGGQWYLVDTTWDAGSVDDRFQKRFGTAQLFTPPEVFNRQHLPDEARWQLVERPVDRATFLSRPALPAEFFAQGLVLLAPDRDRLDAHGSVQLTLRNYQRRHLLAKVRREGAEDRCEVTESDRTFVRCPLRAPGRWELRLYAAPEALGTHWEVLSLWVNALP
ncbi:MAG: transglutaminase [Deltaproteobacteria bacterium]|nr:transglutaminase [Deltaproteobacteria bacterium]